MIKKEAKEKYVCAHICVYEGSTGLSVKGFRKEEDKGNCKLIKT